MTVLAFYLCVNNKDAILNYCINMLLAGQKMKVRQTYLVG